MSDGLGPGASRGPDDEAYQRQQGGILLADGPSSPQTPPDEKLLKALRSAVGAVFIEEKVDDEDQELVRGLIALVEDRYNEAHPLMWDHRKKWALNDEFFLDNHRASWNPEKHRIEKDLPQSAGGSKVPWTQLNIFKPIIITAAARFLATHPQILIKSGTGDKEAVDSARVAQRVVGQFEWYRQDMESVLAEAIPALLLHGTVVLKVEWNPKAKHAGKVARYRIGPDGLPIQQTEVGLDEMGGMADVPVFDEQGKPVFEPELDARGKPVMDDEWEGDIVTSVVPAAEFLVDPTASTWRQRGWCMHVGARTPSWIYNLYGVTVQPDGGVKDEHAFSAGSWGRGGRAPAGSKTTLIKELWIEPGTYRYGPEPGQEFTFPKGYMVAVAGGKLLAHGPNPYKHGQPPFIFIPCLRVPRELWGDTIAHSLRSIQASVNKTAAQIQQANDLCANPQWLLPHDVKMPQADMVNTAGIHKRFEPQPHGIVPQLMPGQGVAHSVFAYLEWILGLVQSIAGQHEGGLAGGVPANVEAGVALEAITERDTSRLAITATEIGRGIRQWAWLTMKLWQQFKTDKQTIAVTGRFMETEVFNFSGSQILDSMDVTVVPESVMPSSRSAKFTKAMTLFQLRDEMGRPGISMRELKRRVGEDSPDFMSREQIEIANAREENSACLRDGRPGTLDQFIEVEDHDLHLEEHRIAMVSPEFRRNPRAFEALKAHALKHLMLKQIKQMEEARMMAIMMPPTGASPGPAGAAMPAAPAEPGDPAPAASQAGPGGVQLPFA